MGQPIDKMTAAVQGFGNVAQYAVKLFTEYGGKVICVSCWDNNDQKTYTFRKMDGLTFEELIGITDKFGTIDKAKAKSLGYEILPGDAWIEQDVDVLMPDRDREPGDRGQREQDQQAREDRRRGRQRPDHARGRQGARGARHLRRSPTSCATPAASAAATSSRSRGT